MSTTSPSPPACKSDLVVWRDSETEQFLVRDRRAGATFRLGEEEVFLLSQLNGRQTPAGICAAFVERFGESLTTEQFQEFTQLAADRGLLSDRAAALATDSSTGAADPLPGVLETRATASGARRAGRVASGMLGAVAACLEWPADFLLRAANWIRSYRLRRLLYVPRPDDIFVATYPRSGTTWMQMILYQLTTDGKMDFPHIAEFCPWFEASERSARGFETRPSPRLFKTHLPWRMVPKGAGRYIYVARSGRDMLVSYYHLLRNYNGYEGTFDEFFEEFLKGKAPHGSWFDHVKGWWDHRDDPNVLFLTYEELSHDLEGAIRRIAAFIGRDAPPERMPGIVERCSFAFMKQHENRFDPAMERLWEQGVQLKAFLRQGRVGDGAVSLTEKQQARLDQAFVGRLQRLGVPLS